MSAIEFPHGATGNMDAQPTAPGANGPNGWPQHPVADSLYETCIVTQGASVDIKSVGADLLPAIAYGAEITQDGKLRNPAWALYNLEQERDDLLSLVSELRADRDAWSARCAALMTELDQLRAGGDQIIKEVKAWARRAVTAERRLAERDGPMRWLSSRNPPT